jgi:hypothetical protein
MRPQVVFVLFVAANRLDSAERMCCAQVAQRKASKKAPARVAESRKVTAITKSA